jgi:hypothetical protein
MLFIRSVPLGVVERCNKRLISVFKLADQSAGLKKQIDTVSYREVQKH